MAKISSNMSPFITIYRYKSIFHAKYYISLLLQKTFVIIISCEFKGINTYLGWNRRLVIKL